MATLISPIPNQPIAESHEWRDWFFRIGQTTNNVLETGISVTITTAKLTTSGTEGSMTFTNGILTAQTQAT